MSIRDNTFLSINFVYYAIIFNKVKRFSKLYWFNRQLRETAHKTQIIVLTCRPTDYLSATELPRDGLAIDDSPTSLLHAVNLQFVMQSANNPTR